MNYRILTLCITVFATSLAGCSSSSNDSAGALTPTVDFTAFVKAELANNSERRLPTDVNAINFSFNDGSNPNAYDELF
ncbi:hypothetical protein [Marinobacter mobilis]|uniref:Uncharacterized protein n=1 Tax=Marinobacter mobilis TaxID=488533 RepID=A0A1H3C851_9GAMM|nr:hypothetical protein [Marinobacter mobilis]SDX49834.1 hypothetical protein SAMN04487960_11056 [Marinobacter mobilis]